MRYLTPTTRGGRTWPKTLSPIVNVPGGSPPPPPPPESSFVTRDATTGNLMLSGSRFRFGGANCANDIGTVGSANNNHYGASVDSDGSYITPHAQVDDLLAAASAMKLGVLKATWSVHTAGHENAVQPTLGVFNDAALDPICYAISQAKALGIRFVLPFSEEYSNKPWYVAQTGGGSNDNFYTRAETIAAYKAHISHVLNYVNPYTDVALKDEPQIVCWQIGNEFTAPSLSWQQYADWGDDIGHHIKVVEGAQQLVQDGHYGPSGSTELMAQTYVDIYDQHAYDQWRTPSFLADEAAFCHSHGKAYFVGEYDWTDAPTNSSLVHTNWTLDQQVAGFETSNIDGSTFWDLLGPNTIWNDGYTLHYNPADSDNMQTRGDMISDHARRMAGITPGVFLLDSCTAADGTALSSHVGETGAIWLPQDGYTGTAAITNGRIHATSGSTQVLYYSSGVPSKAAYTANVDVYTASLAPGSWAGLALRARTKADISYTGYVWNNAGTIYCYLTWQPGDHNFSAGGNFTTIATPAVGSTHNLKIVLEDSGTSTLLSLYWDNTRIIGPITDAAPYASAGRVGLYLGSSTSTTGFHLKTPTATT